MKQAARWPFPPLSSGRCAAGMKAVAAARREGAAGRQCQQRRRIAADGFQAARPRALQRRDRIQQAPGIGMPGRLEEIARRALLGDAPGIHHHHPVGHFGHHAHVVGDENDRRSMVAAQLQHEIEDLRLHRDIQRRCRLVGDQQRRIAGQRHGDDGALAHAAGKFVGIAVHGSRWVGEADLGEKVHGALPCRRFRYLVVRHHLFGDLPADGVDRRQRRHRVLEDHGDLVAPHMPQLPLRQADQLAALVDDRSLDFGVGIDDQADDAEQGDGLARPGFADHAEDLAFAYIERHMVDGAHHALLGAEGNAEIPHAQHGAHRPRPRVRTRGSSTT